MARGRDDRENAHRPLHQIADQAWVVQRLAVALHELRVEHVRHRIRQREQERHRCYREGVRPSFPSREAQMMTRSRLRMRSRQVVHEHRQADRGRAAFESNRAMRSGHGMAMPHRGGGRDDGPRDPAEQQRPCPEPGSARSRAPRRSRSDQEPHAHRADVAVERIRPGSRADVRHEHARERQRCRIAPQPESAARAPEPGEAERGVEQAVERRH